VRDLRVQEFLRELVVGVATPSDLTRSIIVEILHSGEGGDLEQVARISKQISRVYSSPLNSLVFNILHVHIALIFICLIFICAKLVYLLG